MALRVNQEKNVTLQQTPLSVVPQFVPGITPASAIKTIPEMMMPKPGDDFTNMNEADLR